MFYGDRHYPTPTNTYKSLHLHSARKKTLNFTTSQFPLKNGGLLFLQSLPSCTDLAPWISNNVYQYCQSHYSQISCNFFLILLILALTKIIYNYMYFEHYNTCTVIYIISLAILGTLKT